MLAELAEEYSDGILHVTTRQDIQLHFVHIEDTPDLMRRLAASASPRAKRAATRSATSPPARSPASARPRRSTSTPYANAITFFLLGHPDTQDFGRKFKIAFSGCDDEACGLTNFHDIGGIARTRVVDGKSSAASSSTSAAASARCRTRRSSSTSSCPKKSCCRWRRRSAACSRGSARRTNRARRGIKFLVKKLGIDEFKRLVLEERATLRPDPRWTAFLADLHVTDEKPLRPAGALPPGPHAAEGFERWRATNVVAQRQPGYVMATVTLPLGDITSEQVRALADIARRFTGDAMRTTVEQNMLLRWVSEADLPALYDGAAWRATSARAGAGTIADITACPGTDTCKLGISSSRGLAGELRPPAGGEPSIADDANARGAAHQDQRLLQLLRPAPRRRHRASSASAATSTAAACRTSRWWSAASGRRTAAPTAWRSAPSRRSACPRSSSA